MFGFVVIGRNCKVARVVRSHAVHPRMIGTSFVGKPKIRDGESDLSLLEIVGE